MAYLQPVISTGYNAYLTCDDSPQVNMDVGLLVLEAGMEWTAMETEKEMALLLFEGEVTLKWEGREETVSRTDPFKQEAFCLHLPMNTAVKVKAVSHAELYCQAAHNDRAFDPHLYTPGEVVVQEAGNKNELFGAMRRNIKTFFDYESAPWSNMVLGEVLNFPGKWSSYPPHHHPQPEVYFHRFDRLNGFGASFANGQVCTSRNNGLTVILEGFHSQTSAPGYCMCYVWGIRHLPDDPWRKTRIDDIGHEWLWKPDANDHILNPEVTK